MSGAQVPIRKPLTPCTPKALLAKSPPRTPMAPAGRVSPQRSPRQVPALPQQQVFAPQEQFGQQQVFAPQQQFGQQFGSSASMSSSGFGGQQQGFGQLVQPVQLTSIAQPIQQFPTELQVPAGFGGQQQGFGQQIGQPSQKVTADAMRIIEAIINGTVSGTANDTYAGGQLQFISQPVLDEIITAYVTGRIDAQDYNGTQRGFILKFLRNLAYNYRLEFNPSVSEREFGQVLRSGLGQYFAQVNEIALVPQFNRAGFGAGGARIEASLDPSRLTSEKIRIEDVAQELLDAAGRSGGLRNVLPKERIQYYISSDPKFKTRYGRNKANNITAGLAGDDLIYQSVQTYLEDAI